LKPHQDGPAYFPVVAILSLGSPVVMDFTPHARFKQDSQDGTDKDSDFEIGKDKWLDDHHPFSVLLMPRSLLIFKDIAYSGTAIVNPCVMLYLETNLWTVPVHSIFTLFKSRGQSLFKYIFFSQSSKTLFKGKTITEF